MNSVQHCKKKKKKRKKKTPPKKLQYIQAKKKEEITVSCFGTVLHITQSQQSVCSPCCIYYYYFDYYHYNFVNKSGYCSAYHPGPEPSTRLF